MKLQDFIDKNTGQHIDWDGKFGAQCMDLYRFYVRDVWGLPSTPNVVGAFQVFGSITTGYYKFTTGIPEPGDVICWNEGIGKNGHVGVVTVASSNSFMAFQQNAPKSDVNGITGSPCNIGMYNNYKNVIGWFRPISAPAPTPMPAQYPVTIKVKVVVNGGVWPSLAAKMQQIKDWYTQNSGNKINLEFTAIGSNFSSIPFLMDPISQSAVIDEKWFDANVLDNSFHNTTLVIRDQDMPDTLIDPNTHQKLKLLGRTLGFIATYPTKTVIACAENDMSEIYPDIGAFYDYERHELMHSCYMWAGYYIQHPEGWKEYFGTDRTHHYFNREWYPEPGISNPEGAFSELDYQRIFNTLTIKQRDIMIYKRVKINGALAVMIDGPDITTFAKANTPAEWVALGKVYPVVTSKPDGSPDFTIDMPEIIFPVS